MKKLTVIVAIAAGLLGGVLSHYVWPQAVLAQVQAPVPKEIRAQSFALVDDKGEVQAAFFLDQAKGGRATVKLLDRDGREIWRVDTGAQVRPLKFKDSK